MLNKRLGGVSIRRGLVACALVVGLTTMYGVPAGAIRLPSANQDVTAPVLPASMKVSGAIAFVENAINIRLNALANLSTTVADSTTLTTSDSVALKSLIGSSMSGLESLEAKVAKDATLSAAQSDAAAVVLDYHVFAFVTPVVNSVVSVDASLASATALGAKETPILAVITAAGTSRAASSAKYLYASFVRHVSLVERALSQTSATLLDLSPTSVPGSNQTLRAARTAETRARFDLTVANADLGAIVKDLARPDSSGARQLRSLLARPS